MELDLWPRDHDLPPRWDGLPVEWSEWSDTSNMFICPPPKKLDLCGKCKSRSSCLINVGRIWTDPATAPPAVGRERMKRGKHLVGLITAFRCPDCGYDQVMDIDHKMWDLDPTDYTDDGSYDQGGP